MTREVDSIISTNLREAQHVHVDRDGVLEVDTVCLTSKMIIMVAFVYMIQRSRSVRLGCRRYFHMDLFLLTLSVAFEAS